ncbi:MAG: hypothetical protein JSR86_10665 [Proteobacteria bacterium]|nr:hypothetical protein [Pseudomonadota bacterium]
MRSAGELLRLVVVMAAVGAGFVVVLDVGFHAHHQPAPAGLDLVLAPALVVLAAGLGVVAGQVRTWRGGGSRLTFSDRRRLRTQRLAFEEDRRRRIAELAADPVRARYAALVEAGEAWSDEQIAYDLDKGARATCAHLQGLEGALREVGVFVKRQAQGRVTARCVIDPDRLKTRLPLPAGAAFTEGSMGGRSYEDGLFAMVRCAACESRIDVTHRHEAGAGLPVFPAA